MAPAALTRYLRGARAFQWGICDCCLWACGWVEAMRGVDPAAALRGRYASAFGAARHLERAGGLRTLAMREMAAAGLMPTADPQSGDVGIVETDDGLAMAIRVPRGWALKTERGLVVAPLSMLHAWSVL